MSEYRCICGASFKNITDLREHEESCLMAQEKRERLNPEIETFNVIEGPCPNCNRIYNIVTGCELENETFSIAFRCIHCDHRWRLRFGE